MQQTVKFYAAIIGFGKGGKTLASALAAAGREIVLIEKSSEMYGGTCINVGCILSAAGLPLFKTKVNSYRVRTGILPMRCAKNWRGKGWNCSRVPA